MKNVNALIALLIVVTLAPAAFGQSRPRRVEAGEDEPIALEGALIEVPVVVADRTGRYVPNLRQRDFQLLEDGQPQAISYFRSERLPIHVALLLDTSLSTRFALGDIHQAAIDFVHQLLPGDQILIVSFASEVTVEQEFTSDRRLLTDAIQRARPTRGTRLYEAVYGTVTERLRNVDGRKAIVILSDGQDVGSAFTAEQAIGVCAESDVSVYGIRYPRAADLRNDRRWRPARRGLDPFMEAVTTRSGGVLYSAGAIGDIGALFAKVADELRHVYVLGYAPSNPLSNGGYRTIEVSVASQPDLAVRHRLGYQAGTNP